MVLTSGTKLGQYEILSPLGAGAMGEVYRARDSRLNRDVAIKVLLGLSAEPDRLFRFEQEARAAAALNHPNILAIFQMGTHLEDLDGYRTSGRQEASLRVCGAGRCRCARPSIMEYRSRRAWRRPTEKELYIVTSSQKTSSSPKRDESKFWTSGWPRWRR